MTPVTDNVKAVQAAVDQIVEYYESQTVPPSDPEAGWFFCTGAHRSTYNLTLVLPSGTASGYEGWLARFNQYKMDHQSTAPIQGRDGTSIANDAMTCLTVLEKKIMTLSADLTRLTTLDSDWLKASGQRKWELNNDRIKEWPRARANRNDLWRPWETTYARAVLMQQWWAGHPQAIVTFTAPGCAVDTLEKHLGDFKAARTESDWIMGAEETMCELTVHDELLNKVKAIITVLHEMGAPRLDEPDEPMVEERGEVEEAAREADSSSGPGQTICSEEDRTVDQVAELREMIRNATIRESCWNTGDSSEHHVGELPPESLTGGLTFPNDCWKVSLEQMVTCLMRIVGQETANVARECRAALDHMTVLDEIRDSRVLRGNSRFPDSRIFALAYAARHPNDFETMMKKGNWDRPQCECHNSALPDYLSFIQQFCFPAQSITIDHALRGAVPRQGARTQRSFTIFDQVRTAALVLADARIMPVEVTKRWEDKYHTEVGRIEISGGLPDQSSVFTRNDIIATASMIAHRLPESTTWVEGLRSHYWKTIKDVRNAGQRSRLELPASVHVYWTWEDYVKLANKPTWQQLRAVTDHEKAFFEEVALVLRENRIVFVITMVSDGVTHGDESQRARSDAQFWLEGCCTRYNIVLQAQCSAISTAYMCYRASPSRHQHTLAKKILEHFADMRVALEASPPLAVQFAFYGPFTAGSGAQASAREVRQADDRMTDFHFASEKLSVASGQAINLVRFMLHHNEGTIAQPIGPDAAQTTNASMGSAQDAEVETAASMSAGANDGGTPDDESDVKSVAELAEQQADASYALTQSDNDEIAAIPRWFVFTKELGESFYDSSCEGKPKPCNKKGKCLDCAHKACSAGLQGLDTKACALTIERRLTDETGVITHIDFDQPLFKVVMEISRHLRARASTRPRPGTRWSPSSAEFR